MQKELQEKLVNDFSTLFKQWHIGPHESVIGGRGIECWDGWYRIIYDLCQRLIEMDYDDFVEFGQIKQKFATLVVYLDPKHKDIRIPDGANTLVTRARNQSEIICEVCGERGKKRPGSYILTLCDTHQEHRENNERFWLNYEEDPLKKAIREKMLEED